MIQGYPRWPSIRPGETLTLHVSTDQPHFRIDAYRQGRRLEPMGRLGPERLRGCALPPGPPDRDWGWRGYDVRIPPGWPSGAYVALLVPLDAAGRAHDPPVPTADGADGRALFVVRSARPGRDTSVLYKLSWATFHAYNGTGGGSLYAQGTWSALDEPPGFKVTWRRPGGGTGGTVMPGDSPDAHEPGVRRQTFAKWDAPFIAWLEGEGYRVDYCTDWDLHADPDLLAPYRLLLSVGHDEYWSDAMRDRLAAFAGAGGNLAFLSGNIAGYRIHFTDGGTAITCAKLPPAAGAPRRWAVDRWPPERAEAAVTGVSFDHGGGWWHGRRESLGYTVQHADHWVYEGTGLRDGEVFGADPAYPLVGYEVDGVPYARRDGVAVPAPGPGRWPEMFILGLAELGPGWVAAGPRPAATMGILATSGGGLVFQAATTDWPIVVPRDRRVARITRNVLDRLRLPSIRLVGPLPARGGRLLAVEGEAATFHADLAPFPDPDRLALEWHVVGGRAEPPEGPLVRVTMPTPPRPVTVAVTARRDGVPLGFGSLTLLPLGSGDALKRETLVLLREMVAPSAPEKPLVAATRDPREAVGLLYGVRLPWIAARAARLREVATRLGGAGPAGDAPR